MSLPQIKTIGQFLNHSVLIAIVLGLEWWYVQAFKDFATTWTGKSFRCNVAETYKPCYQMHPEISSWRITFMYQDCGIQNTKPYSFTEHTISPPKRKMVFVSSMQHIHCFSKTHYWSLNPLSHLPQTLDVCIGKPPLLDSIKSSKISEKTTEMKGSHCRYSERDKLKELNLSLGIFSHIGQIKKMPMWETVLEVNIAFWDYQSIVIWTLLKNSLDFVLT